MKIQEKLVFQSSFKQFTKNKRSYSFSSKRKIEDKHQPIYLYTFGVLEDKYLHQKTCTRRILVPKELGENDPFIYTCPLISVSTLKNFNIFQECGLEQGKEYYIVDYYNLGEVELNAYTTSQDDFYRFALSIKGLQESDGWQYLRGIREKIMGKVKLIPEKRTILFCTFQDRTAQFLFPIEKIFSPLSLFPKSSVNHKKCEGEIMGLANMPVSVSTKEADQSKEQTSSQKIDEHFAKLKELFGSNWELALEKIK